MTSPADAREFISQHHHAVLITERADGRPQASPVAATVDSEGRVVVSTRETAMKVKNLEKRPRASLMVMSDEFYGPWVQVDGPVDIVRLPVAMEPLVDYYRRVAGDHDDWDDYRRAMEAERRVLLRLTIDEAGPDTSG